eukprot:9885490-Heterocapsa_arctica.AAC.1
MSVLPWGDGAEEKGWGGYPPEPEAAPEGEVRAQLRCCGTCGLDFMAVPQGTDGYLHTHCCSSCTATGGWRHSK